MIFIGIPVVTANKALLEAELEKVGEISTGLFFEAAVCGGIPIISTLAEDYVADSIKSIKGIMNGTTNFILSICLALRGNGAAFVIFLVVFSVFCDVQLRNCKKFIR